MKKLIKLFFVILFCSNYINAQEIKSDLSPNLVFDSGHFYYLDKVVISNDKKKLASSTTKSPEIIVWDILSSKQLKKINLSEGNDYWELEGYEFSPDNLKLIISYHNINEYGILIYDLEKNKSFILTKTRKREISFEILKDENEIIFYKKNSIEIYDLLNYKLKKKYNNLKIISDIYIGPNKNYFIGYSNKSYIAFDYHTGKKINEIKYKFTDKNVFFLDFKPYVSFINSNEVIINNEDGDLVKWNFINEDNICNYKNPHNSLNIIIAISNDGKNLATYSKSDKNLCLYDLKNFCEFKNPLKEMHIEDIPEAIYFSNDEPIINYVIEDGIIKIDINSWSICSSYDDAEFVPVNRTSIDFNGKFLRLLDKNNFFVTSQSNGKINLYETQNNRLTIFREFKSNKTNPKSAKCFKNDIIICYDKKIKKYNTLNRIENDIFSINREEEEEENDSLLIFKGVSKFLDIAFLNKSNYYVIAKFQDFRYKLIFQPINPIDSIYYYYPKDSEYYYNCKNHSIISKQIMEKLSIDEEKERVKKLELRKINSSKSEKYIVVNWGIFDYDSMFTEIIDSKTGKFVKSIVGKYKFNSDETMIAYYPPNREYIYIYNFETNSTIEVKDNEVNFNHCYFSKNSKFINYTNFDKKQKTVIIDSNNYTTDNQSKYILHSNRFNNNLSISEFNNSGMIKLIKDFSKDVPYGEFIDKIENDSLIYIIKDLKVHVYDLKTFDKLFVLEGHKNRILDVFLNDDKSQLITYSNDNMYKFWDVKTGMEIYSRLFSDNNNFDLIMLPNSPYYMCSKDISKLLHYVTPNLKVIGFDQLDPIYNRPDIVLESIGNYFGGVDEQLVSQYRSAWEKRIERLGLDKDKLGKGEFDLPEAEIENAKAIAYENKEGKITIHLKVNDINHSLNRYNILVNEVPIYGSQGISLRNLNTRKWDTTVIVPLSIGENKIQVSVINELGLENFKYPTYVNYVPKSNEIVAKTYYIGIGVDDFKQERINNKETKLNFCVKDVNDLGKVFSEDSNTVVKLYTNEQVNKENILSIKNFLLKNTTVNDRVIISCSSHGLLDKKNNFYLAMHNIDFDNPSDRGLAYEELENLLDGIPARKKLLLLDACNSGENELVENNNQQAENSDINKIAPIVASRTITSVEPSANNSFHKMNELFINTRNKTGSVIISAAGGRQSALEGSAVKINDKPIENGAFTYAVMEYLKNNKSNTEKFTVNLLKKYVENRVVEITKGKQKPTSRQETMEIDWGLK